MQLCFVHEPFDRDVSSGTIHALYQWFELLQAFGITGCAIINKTDDALPMISSLMSVTEYSSFAGFDRSESGSRTYLEMGGQDYRSVDYSGSDWLIVGGVGGLARADISIPTNGVALYPREAAAIALSRL